ncbi:MAG: hypothetical protein HXK17_08910, partial [Alloprevotella sp.]|nr:hypothetical protein [Alloprevotella sp.]
MISFRHFTTFLLHSSLSIGLMLMLFLTCSVVSCDKLPRNGKLDGHWQLMEY